jgi:hypothetical protein
MPEFKPKNCQKKLFCKFGTIAIDDLASGPYNTDVREGNG